jgi:hypothetical protein
VCQVFAFFFSAIGSDFPNFDAFNTTSDAILQPAKADAAHG